VTLPRREAPPPRGVQARRLAYQADPRESANGRQTRRADSPKDHRPTWPAGRRACG